MSAKAMKSTLQVVRNYVPLAVADYIWELHPFEAVVWDFDGTDAHYHQVHTEPNYMAGLLRCLIDGRQVNTSEFDVVLKKYGLETREEIENRIQPRYGGAIQPHVEGK